VLPFYPEYNSVSTIRIRLQKVIKYLGLLNILIWKFEFDWPTKFYKPLFETLSSRFFFHDFDYKWPVLVHFADNLNTVLIHSDRLRSLLWTKNMKFWTENYYLSKKAFFTIIWKSITFQYKFLKFTKKCNKNPFYKLWRESGIKRRLALSKFDTSPTFFRSHSVHFFGT
jgi:hypothetical protein